MRAEVTKAFPGRPDNQPLTRQIMEGEEISGELAEVAVRQGWAKKIGEKAAVNSQASAAKAPSGKKGAKPKARVAKAPKAQKAPEAKNNGAGTGEGSAA